MSTAIAALLVTSGAVGFYVYQETPLPPLPIEAIALDSDPLLTDWPPLEPTYEEILRPQLLAAEVDKPYFFAPCQSWAGYQGLIWKDRPRSGRRAPVPPLSDAGSS